jgi:hypothetical protein
MVLKDSMESRVTREYKAHRESPGFKVRRASTVSKATLVPRVPRE